MPWPAAMAAVVYRPHEPQHTVLWQAVKEHLPAFLTQTSEADRPLPGFVKKELLAFLDCGVLERGFARVACGECGLTRLVPWSCKGRGVCPSCVARRMSDTAAHLVDHVLPEVAVRQWVLSVPPPLRYLLAWDTELCAAVVRLFVRAVLRHLAAVARRRGVVQRLADAQGGAVCMVQRWGGSGNLNVHLHALVADGVFVAEPAGDVAFRALPAPETAEIAAVAWDVCQRVVALLRKRGQWLDAPPDEDRLAQTEPLLAQLYGASIAGTLVLGPKAGQRQLRLFGAPARGESEGVRLKNAYGFDVDASVRIPGHDRPRLERLARYMARPPLSKDRLARQSDGTYRITLKKPWRDGTTHIVLSGPELVGRLAALVPPPRFHLTRYFGVFAARAKLRRAVVPGYHADVDPAGAAPPVSPESTGSARRRMAWPSLLARVFAVDVLMCPKCSSRLSRVELCTRPERIRAVLATTGPPGEAKAVA